MSPFFLFLLTLIILAVATVTSESLALFKGPSETIDNLRARVRSWWGMILIFSLTVWLGNGAIVALFAALSFAALREIATISTRDRADHLALAASFFLILPVQYISIYQDWYGFYTVFIPVYAFLGLPTLAALRGNTDNFLNRVSQTQWSLMIAVFCISHIPALLFLDIPGYETPLFLIIFLLIIVQGSDVLQYIWGKLLGRHKIAPRLSPNKTWEGFLGGTISAGILGMALHGLTPFTALEAFVLAMMAAIAGFFGGLVLSAVKRDRNIKDWSHLIDGHGGVFDRLDSLAFAAPIFFHITRFFWEG